jgi:hypothetical protein
MQDINKQVARSVRFDIAKDRNEEFHKLFKSEVLPVLKKQDGFKDELLLVHDQHVRAISVWNNADAARKYETATYPQVDKALRPVMTGTPMPLNTAAWFHGSPTLLGNEDRGPPAPLLVLREPG